MGFVTQLADNSAANKPGRQQTSTDLVSNNYKLGDTSLLAVPQPILTLRQHTQWWPKVFGRIEFSPIESYSKQVMQN